MRALGLYKELEPRRPGIFRESLIEAVRVAPGRLEGNLAEYLDSGIPLVDIMESTTDVVGGEERISGGSSILTDGSWVWRQDLPFYVRNYHLVLDDNFIAHAVEMNFVIPQQERATLLALADTVTREVLNMS
ncbi:hypothetical protein [Actinoplanes sp. NPDC051859]|uniref:hypothetical protein n=1 Tax=Actinoplanes sp. NPDC051859 TaxID=3363909 RepID=UPI00379BEF6A